MYNIMKNEKNLYDICIDGQENGFYKLQPFRVNFTLEEIMGWIEKHNAEIERMLVREKKN